MSLQTSQQEAEALLEGTAPWPSAKDCLDLAKRLQDGNYFAHARKILARARERLQPDEIDRWRVKLAGEQAMCTYKDQDLSAEERFDMAEKVLFEEADLATTRNQDILGKAGAIFKRRWELDGRRRNLELACDYYLRGYELGAGKVTETAIAEDYDYGFTGIAAAWNLDLLAQREIGDGGEIAINSRVAAGRRRRASAIRGELLDTLRPLPDHPGLSPKKDLKRDWWFLATIAEAYFGLRRYENAHEWLQRAKKLRKNVPDWKYTTTARQLFRLAGMHVDKQTALARAAKAAKRAAEAGDQDAAAALEAASKKARRVKDGPEWQYSIPARELAELTRRHGAAADAFEGPAWDVLRKFLGDDAESMRALFAGKVGLALSGGGFRASLFHIGVLARLAELDMLRHVEAISCVSGGSIIGAHYYLEVRKLLEERDDGAIRRDDYIEIVERIARQFLAGVQRNLRTRILAELTTNLKVLLPRHSRTGRLSELYEEEIYSRVEDGEGGRERLLKELLVKPMGPDGKPLESFGLRYDNWRRRNKVPVLILNATTLNTGHNWQFTASWMGEPPASIDPEIDGNYRLRRMYYRDQAPPPHDRIRLGQAVAASACVPGAFKPLFMTALYPGRTVRLVDGGLHDNQGVVGLLAEGCAVMLVSDSSGQMSALDDPGTGMLEVPMRSNNILMSRVREAEYHDLKGRRQAALLRGFMYVHLKKGLDVKPVAWTPRDPAPAAGKAARAASDNDLWRDETDYGIRKDVQQRLADIRTDLDSFCDAEAHALMTSGYRMTSHEFPRSIAGFPVSEGTRRDWEFLKLEPLMGEVEPAREEACRRLITLLDAASGGFFKIWKLWFPSRALRRAGILAIAVPFLALLGAGPWMGWKLLSAGALGMVPKLALILPAGLLWVLIVGWLAARTHLHVFDKLYLRWGRLERLVGAAR